MCSGILFLLQFGDVGWMEFECRWLDRAAIIEKDASGPDTHSPWRLCSISQVEETKRIIHLIPVWATTAAVSLVFSQLQTYTISQGLTFDRKLTPHFEIPAPSLTTAIVLFAMITVPIYDKLLVPLARRYTKHPYGLSTLQRLGMSIVLAMLTMIVSALVERKRLTYVRDLGLENMPLGSFVLPMKMWWLLPQFFLAAQLELFLFVASYEFYYYEASDHTRSISSSFTYSASAMGYYLTTVLSDIVNAVTKGESVSILHLHYVLLCIPRRLPESTFAVKTLVGKCEPLYAPELLLIKRALLFA